MGGEAVSKKRSRFRAWLVKRRKRRAERRKRLFAIPHLFAKAVIVHCILVVTAAAYYSLYAQRNGAEMTELFRAIGYFFITELAFLFGKTIWDGKWKRREEKDCEDTFDQQDI